MAKGEHILISLSRRHADNIFSGRKQVELRRRSMNVLPGTTVWVYVKLPVGSVVGRAKVGAVHASSPATLWRRFGSISGLSRKEFFDYFEGVAAGVALVLENAQRLRSSLSLDALRELADGFHPPQFFARLGEKHPFLDAVAPTR
ncbi:transcriptional regulator [Sulfuricaulis sp.]|uniref:transcriptional regulator n=1 Tax=Sulfuricaulis sp. TaxID=2003553 RepID=UPI0034A18E51